MHALIKKLFNREFFEPILYGVVLFVIVVFALFGLPNKKGFSIQNAISTDTSKIPPTSNAVIPIVSTTTIPAKVVLDIPYTDEVPSGTWTGPWKNACEEASITMVENFYRGEKTISKSSAITFMQMLFDAENKIYGSNANSDATRSNYLVNNYTSFKGVVKTNPTIEDIKAEIRAGHPVISFHNGFDLNNKDIPFLPTGSAYHSTVIVGYDDVKKVFIVNDPGDRTLGKNHVYGYDLYMNSLHDYNYPDKKADGPARVIFTTK